MANPNEAEKRFYGKSLEPVARNGGVFHFRIGSKAHPHQSSARDPMTPVAANG